VVRNALMDSGLTVYRREKSDCLCLVKRLMFNMLHNTPCVPRCLRRAQDGPARSGQVMGMQDGSGWSGQVNGMQDGAGWSGQVRKPGWTWREEAELVRGTLRTGREDDMDGL
jgi:hypothetical protein